MQFDPQAYGQACQPLLEERPPCELGPGTPNQNVLERLRGLDERALLGDRPIADREMAACCLSGLWLLHNYLDESHRISQDVHSTSGSYWHGIMHRREGDFSNAKYWFRRVGGHPVFPPLCEIARKLSARADLDDAAGFLAERTSWDPFGFVDLCEAVIRGRSRSEQLARQIAQAEWQLLFDFCYQSASAG